MLKFLVIFIQIYLARSQTTTSWPIGTYVPNICVCGAQSQCAFAGTESSFDGSGMIQGRILTNGSNANTTLGTNSSICQPVSTGIVLQTPSQDSCDPNLLSTCCPLDGYTCGIRYPPVPGSPQPTLNSGQASYGAHPYLAIILSNFNVYISGGVLIDQYHVLTVAHKIQNLTEPMKVRLGDWDAADIYEPLPTVEFNATFVIHPNFNARSLRNNIAVIRLATPVNLGQYPHIGSICLPNVTLSGMRCWVSGFGRNATDENGRYQRIMKEVDVPLVDTASCQKKLRMALGNTFALDRNSFICAGGEEGRDSCSGDGGSPLTCFVGDRFYLMGLVAWGVSCGLAGYPSVYVNVQNFIPWIQNTAANFTRMNTSAASRTTVKAARTVQAKVTKKTPKPTTTTRKAQRMIKLGQQA